MDCGLVAEREYFKRECEPSDGWRWPFFYSDRCPRCWLIKDQRDALKRRVFNIREILTIAKARCVACGNMENLDLDHIIPLNDLGGNDISNIQILCRSCHKRKHEILKLHYKRGIEID